MKYLKNLNLEIFLDYMDKKNLSNTLERIGIRLANGKFPGYLVPIYLLKAAQRYMYSRKRETIINKLKERFKEVEEEYRKSYLDFNKYIKELERL